MTHGWDLCPYINCFQQRGHEGPHGSNAPQEPYMKATPATTDAQALVDLAVNRAAEVLIENEGGATPPNNLVKESVLEILQSIMAFDGPSALVVLDAEIERQLA